MTIYITPRAAALDARQYRAMIMREKLGLPADPVRVRAPIPPRAVERRVTQ
jgi:hypothetical protein